MVIRDLTQGDAAFLKLHMRLDRWVERDDGHPLQSLKNGASLVGFRLASRHTLHPNFDQATTASPAEARKTLDEIERERQWTAFAALCLFIAFCFGAIGAGYANLLTWALTQTEGRTEILAHAIAAALLCVCVLPGAIVWRSLRTQSRRAVLYGLVVAAVVSVGASMALASA